MTTHSDSWRRIVESASELFSAHSYYEVSMDEIARHAGVSKGGVFHHFGSKYELASQALEHAYSEMWSHGLAELEQIPDPVERIRVIIAHLVEMAFGGRGLGRMALDVVAESIKHDDGPESWAPMFAEMERVIARSLEECGVPGAEAKAAILVGAVDSLAMQAAFIDRDNDPLSQTIKDELFELFVGNYLNDE